MYLGGKLLPETAMFWPLPANRARKRIPAQKSAPRMLVKTTASQLVSQDQRPHCLVLLDPPRKTTHVSSGIRISNAPARLHYGSSTSKEAPHCVQGERRQSLNPRATETSEWYVHLRVLYIIREGGPGVRVWTSEPAKAEADK
jgi:hypothetical protein